MYSKEERYRKAQKRVKAIQGFYTHLLVSVFIIPFIIFINLDGSPQFHWFWIFIGAWILGLIIHWVNVFGFSKMGLKNDWEERKIREIVGDEDFDSIDTNSQRAQELMYMKAKKRIQDVKGFYTHAVVMVFTIPLIIWVNLEFVPGFHFFWYAVGGMLLSVFFHWLGVFGFSYLGMGKDWEQRKIQEFMKQEN